MRFRIVRHEVVDSTSERAFAALAAGEARHGDVHVARAQTAGRGRRGASWYSAADEGLYMSVVLRPPPPPLQPATLTMAAGLAAHAAVRALAVGGVSLKWPNDVEVRGAKLAGILVETRGLDPARPHYVVGIGVNVRQRDFPAPLRAEREVTSLLLLGCDTSVEAVRDALLRELATRLEQVREPAQRLCADYLDATGLRGRAVRVDGPAGEVRGTLRDLSLARGLELELEGGALPALLLEHVRAVSAV